jgi:hypothetical protein
VDSKEVEAIRFQDIPHTNVGMLSAQSSGRLYLPGNIHGNHFCQSLSRPLGHNPIGSIMSMKNSGDTIGNRTRDRPAGGTVPQQTTTPRTPVHGMRDIKFASVLLSVSGLSVRTVTTVANQAPDINDPNTP